MALSLILEILTFILTIIVCYTVYKQNELIKDKEVELDIAREEYSLLLESNKEIRDENLELKLDLDTYKKVVSDIDKVIYQNNYNNEEKKTNELKLNQVKKILKNRTIKPTKAK